MSTPLVSVIIPTYNSERTIEKCLKSVLNQKYKNIELIVVDNNSKDKTFSIAKNFTDNVFQKGPERCAQRNFGVKKAKGKFLLIHDSDIYFNSNTIEECVKEAQNKDLDLIIIPEKSIGNGFWTKVKSFERSFYIGNEYIEAARFFKKEAFLKVGGYDENLVAGEDWDLHIRIKKAGYKVGRIDSLVLHDEGSLTLFESSKKKKYYANDLFNKYSKKHPDEFKKQMSFFVRFPLRKIFNKGIRHPILFFGMIIMKLVEYLSSRDLL